MSETVTKSRPATDTRQHSTSQSNSNTDLRPGRDILEYAQQYARDKPDVAALWCFGIGFVVGWKLKPW